MHRLRFGWKGNGVAVAIVIGYRMCNGVACTVTCRKRPHDVGKPLCFLLLSSKFPWIIEPCIGILPSQPLLQCRGMLLCVVPDMTVCCSNIAHTDLISVALYTVPNLSKFGSSNATHLSNLPLSSVQVNRANQLNPCHAAFHKSRGLDPPAKTATQSAANAKSVPSKDCACW